MDRATSIEDLNRKLAALEQRLRAFDVSHAPQHSLLIRELRARERALRGKIDAAIDRDDRWEMVRDEFLRDFTGLSEQVSTIILGAGEDRGAGPTTDANDTTP